MPIAIAVLFAAAGVLNLLPLIGVASAARVDALYGVEVRGADLAILMRHRAVLLAIVGGLLLTAAALPALRWTALIAGLASMGSFIALAGLEGGGNALLRRVVLADWIGCAALVVAGALMAVRG